MTVVAASLIEKAVACDSFSSRGATKPGFYVHKVAVVGSLVVGCAGPGQECAEYLKAIEQADDPLQVPGTHPALEAVLLTPTCLHVTLGLDKPQPVEGKFYAVGSGAAYALGALEAGANLKTSLKFSCKYDPACKPPILLTKSNFP